MGKSIITEQQINAPADQVWKTLVDFQAYPEWNSFIKSAALPGEFKAGESINISVQPPGKGVSKFKSKLVVVDPVNYELRWSGSLPIPGLFIGVHYFRVEPQGPQAAKLVHGEDFRGLLVGLLGGLVQAAEQGFKNMNTELKQRAEAAA